MGISIVYFETARGEKPVQKYIESLALKDRVKVKALIDYLSEQVVLHEPQAKKITGYPGLFELRQGVHRVFYCYYKGKVVLLHAFRKSSNKTPKSELLTAFKRMTS